MIAPGTRLGPYEILAPVGAGGMGEVWRARDTKLDREVALKFLPASFAEDPERLLRFEREAKVLASLNHPSIAAIYGFHEHDGHRFLAMELAPGVDLAERLKHGRMSVRESIDAALQIADALEAAHERGIVHRDLKPANIKLTPEGQVKVLDFGLAKAFDVAQSSGATRDPSMSPTITSLGTVAGVILGTAAYMSPEAARGRTVDKRADIWAFGCVLYEMLSGRMAFAGETISDTMAAVLTRDPDWGALPEDTPPRLRALLVRCLQKDPKERLRDIGDARIELREATRPERVLEVAPVPVASKRLPRWILGAAAIVALAAAIFAFLAGRGSIDARPPVFRPLTLGNGVVYSARFTPDGGTVIYGAAFGGSPLGLFSMKADGLESRPVDVPSADIAGISRDNQLALILGRHYMGSWLRVGTLAQVSLSGGTPRELLENVYDADISPDGKQFAVVLADGEDQVLQYPIGKELYRTRGWISQPRIAPDGLRIAFNDHRLWGDDLGEPKVIGTDGKVQALGTEKQYAQGLCWRPDGKSIWYSIGEDFEGGEVLSVEPGRAPRIMARVPTPARIQDVAADGRILLVSDDTWVTLTGQLAGDSSERVYTFWSNETVAGISPDGTSFTGNDSVAVDGEYSVFFRRGDSAPIRLGRGGAVGMMPDAKHVLTTTVSGATRGLSMMPVGAGQPRALDLHGVAFRGDPTTPVQFSSDGKKFAFVGAKEGEGRAVWVVDLGAGGVPRKVSPEGASAAIISPDGTKVVAVDATRGMYVISDAGNVPVPGAPKSDVAVAWSSDSTSVLSWDKALPPRIFKTDLASGRRELLRELRPIDPAGVAYAWLVVSPDGRYYLERCRRMRSYLDLVTLHG